MNGDSTAQALHQRSTFVTVLAWIFIVVAGFSTVIGVIQNIMLTVFPAERLNDLLAQVPGVERMPPMYKFMLSHMRGFVLGASLVSVFGLVVSIGLLKRKNWARIAFIMLIVLGIIWTALSIIWQFSFIQSVPGMVGVQAPSGFRVIQAAIMIFSLVIALGFAVLYGWIIKKLLSEKIRSEFTGN